ncbi:MAG: phage holin family protein, partial [Plesiomonas sp.]
MPGLVEIDDAQEGVMPEKDPSFWAWFSAWLYHSMPTIYAMLLAVVIAALRVMYGGGTKRKMLLEGALCGSLSLGAVSA